MSRSGQESRRWLARKRVEELEREKEKESGKYFDRSVSGTGASVCMRECGWWQWQWLLAVVGREEPASPVSHGEHWQ